MNNLPDQQRYQELARKWLDKTITPEEQKEFAAWYNANQDTPLEIPSTFAGSEDELRERILNNINSIIDKKNDRSKRTPPGWWISVAASILLLVAASVFFHLREKKTKPLIAHNQKRHLINDVAPGGNKALLTLADGSKVVLNDAKNGLLGHQGLTSLNKAKNDELIYDAGAAPTKSAPAVYNTVSTPKGGEFQLVLSDGSKVWLNAASSITFPTVFSGKERRVTITGEVYFEVAKNKQLPFRVVASKQTVEVLGTHFDINAYTDENAIKTTLIEGRVRVSSGNHTAILSPDQQSNISTSGSDQISIKTVDTDNVLAWTNGNFDFEREDLQTIMRQVTRWYDVDVKYEGRVPQKSFTGSISRNVNLSELLNMLKYTGINFKINGQTVVVTP